MADDTQVIGVRFPLDRVEEIEARAEAEGITKSEFIRDAVYRELGETLLKDRVELLEDAVEFLLEDSAPNDDVQFVNSPNYEFLETLQSE